MIGIKQCFSAMPDLILEIDAHGQYSWQWRGFSGTLLETKAGLVISLEMPLTPESTRLQDSAVLLLTTTELSDAWWHLSDSSQVFLNSLIPKCTEDNPNELRERLLRFLACARFFCNLWLGKSSKGTTLKRDMQDFMNDIV